MNVLWLCVYVDGLECIICEIASSPHSSTTLQFLHLGGFLVAWPSRWLTTRYRNQKSPLIICSVDSRRTMQQKACQSRRMDIIAAEHKIWKTCLGCLKNFCWQVRRAVEMRLFLISKTRVGSHRSFQTQGFLRGFWKWTPANSGGSDARFVIQGKYGYRMPSCTTKTATWF